MQSIFTNRQTSAAATSRVLAVVAVLWVNLAVQPCAMAFDADFDCPHCPPAVDDGMAMHHGHGEEDAKSGCATQPSDCGELDDFGFDSRGTQNKLKDNAETVAISVALPPGAIADPVGFSTTAADRVDASARVARMPRGPAGSPESTNHPSPSAPTLRATRGRARP